MAKFKPGIPDTFNLEVQPVHDLGDYLDEPGPSPVAQRKARGEVAPEVIASSSRPTEKAAATVATRPLITPVQSVMVEPRVVAPPAAAVTPAPQPAVVRDRDEADREERGGKPKAPRREISMTPDTLRMSDELLDIIRSGSGQRDTKANELFHALVLLVHEVKDQLDPHAIPKRGRWGTPTARAYPLELKNAFLRALLERHASDTENQSARKFTVNGSA